ncbi:putative nucleic acid-binding protein [Microbacterium sp. W4I4]|uniref:PIN domain-containing protein n=1 Tax=Microbacterium sp. W4I4 TaxID=3042295 RepID=UPI00278110E1|nr:PIN domain-containing protein [Microbacterium sp. W4I4]MDQ0614653.1 putative nucleic acid-binding protein [Microbacterium sp. W4I4]
MILLDTNALIRIDELASVEDSLAISALSLAELRFGIEHAPDLTTRRRRTQELGHVEDLLRIPWLPFDRDAAEGYGRMAAVVAPTRPAHARSKDVILAGHAYALGAAFMTFNGKDLELLENEIEIIIPELR